MQPVFSSPLQAQIQDIKSLNISTARRWRHGLVEDLESAEESGLNGHIKCT